MAGGKLAQSVSCLICLEEGQVSEARRTYEGDENDEYTCPKGHKFSMNWSGGEATEALWPPSTELTRAMEKEKKIGGAR